MYEQNTTPGQSAAQQDAIDVSDFVYAATGARVRRVTLPSGEHWFPAVDVAGNLGYVNTRQALLQHVAAEWQQSLGDVARSVYPIDASRNMAGHGLKKSMRMVNLQGMIQLVGACTKPDCVPFKKWVAEVVATVQHDGSYALEPASVQPAPDSGVAYAMPQQVADAIVRLEERNIRADEAFAVWEAERNELLREANRSRSAMAEALHRIGGSIDRLADRLESRQPAAAEPTVTPQELLATWRERHLVVTDDVHAVAAYLAPALVRGEARYRLEEIAGRTGLPLDRVHDCVRMLLKRGCMRQTGCASDGAPVYVLP
ncbi:BRO-N domain-containing protein [Streptomyces beijiangensis]|uniref:Bro-N domain-containing protein n=1 Tax=Streptomyces beijiangensis TaxID=163361 RepID=A0A939F4B3_9ACTN|nr:Bro-N domain-containing protein [Streptomyces beijiangensis]MBO0510792.1 Bro-N domain-containing protein [Streptomyces beijiangensis]